MKIRRLTGKGKEEGFALAEIMVSAVVMIIAFVGILLTYIKCQELNEISRNKSMATRAAKSRMEVIRNTDFTQLSANYHNVPFFDGNINGAGVSYVDTTDPDIFQITVSFSWQQKSGLVVGEDQNINGVLNAGEDADGNGMLDSIVQLTTFVYNE